MRRHESKSKHSISLSFLFFTTYFVCVCLQLRKLQTRRKRLLHITHNKPHKVPSLNVAAQNRYIFGSECCWKIHYSTSELVSSKPHCYCWHYLIFFFFFFHEKTLICLSILSIITSLLCLWFSKQISFFLRVKILIFTVIQLTNIFSYKANMATVAFARVV